MNKIDATPQNCLLLQQTQKHNPHYSRTSKS